MTTLAERISRGSHEHGERFDPASLEGVDQSIKDAYTSGLRVRVETTYTSPEFGESTYVRTGVVSTTTGWKPAFLLMHRSSDHESSDLLEGTHHKVTATKRGRKYVPGTPYGR